MTATTVTRWIVGCLPLLFAALWPACVAASPIDDVAVASPLMVATGRSTVVGLDGAATRVAISDPRIADYVLVSPKQLYVYGKAVGHTTLLVWSGDGLVRRFNVSVDLDLDELRNRLAVLLPRETSIEVRSVGNSIVLGGAVSDVIAAEQANSFAEAYARSLNPQQNASGQTGATPTDGAASTPMPMPASNTRVINTLRIRDPQQVMLEVRIAEVSKNLLQSLGSQLDGTGRAGEVSWNLTSGFLNPGSPLAALLFRGRGVTVDAKQDKGVFRILAEPTIIAVSGEEGSFLAGGRLLIPVNQGNASVSAVTLQERDFGVGLRFRPTVLDDGRISLKVAPEVTEIGTQALQVAGANGVTTSAIPSFTLRRVSTTVQMKNGESLVIAGLLKDNLRNAVKQIPLLGDVPILGALFRSTNFQSDMTELVVVVTPRLVGATEQRPPLPTDRYVPPSGRELFGEGRVEGAQP